MQCAKALETEAAIGWVLMNHNATSASFRSTAQLLQESAVLVDAFPANGGVEFAVTPRFAVLCTEELLFSVRWLAAERETLIQTHFAETVPECQLVCDLFGTQATLMSITGLIR